MKTEENIKENIYKADSIFVMVVLFMAVLFFYSSCTNKKESVTEQGNIKKTDTIISPTTVIISNPKIVVLDTCPLPQKITIPTTVNDQSIRLKNGTTVKLAPAEVKPAGFLIQMQNYTSEHGLALETIICAFLDKKGNLWFGTYGGGASRYDGKSFTNFTVENGLTSNLVNDITNDKDGNIWFCTEGEGISKYDGKTFTNYTTVQGLCDNLANSILVDKSGNVWIGTNTGISKYDLKKALNPCNQKKCGHNLNILKDLEQHNKQIAKSFTNYKIPQILPHTFIASMVEDKDNNIWFCTNGDGLYKYNGKSFTHFTTAQGLVKNNISCSLKDRKGNLWFGSPDSGISCFNGKNFTNFTTEKGVLNNPILKIAEDRDGTIWFGTGGGGALYYDGKSFGSITTKEGLANNTVNSVTEDQTGAIWFGTEGGGLSRFVGKSLIHFTDKQGIVNNTVWGILEDKNKNIWFGTSGGGVSRYNGNRIDALVKESKTKYGTKHTLDQTDKNFTNFTTSQGIVHNVILTILEDQLGKIWFGGHGGGVSRYDGKSFTNFTKDQGLVHISIRHILLDKRGNIWFGTTKGVSRYDGNRVEAIVRGDKVPLQEQKDLKKIKGKFVKTFTNFTTDDGLSDNLIRCIAEDRKGNIWFGTNSGGLSRYDGNRIDAIENGKIMSMQDTQDLKKVNGKFVKTFTNFKTDQGLPNNCVLSITEDKMGNIWIGTLGGGLSRYDGKSFITYSTQNGLPDIVISQIKMVQRGNIAIGTNFGLAILTAFILKDKTKTKESALPPQNNMSNKALKNYAPVFEIYNSANGYPVKDINTGQNAMYEDSNNMLWIGTGSYKTALIRFDYTSIKKSKLPPRIYIQAVKINDEKICWNDLLPTDSVQKGRFTNNNKEKPTNITEEVTTFGRELSKTERDSMRKKFGDIRFDDIAPFYPLPVNLVLPYNDNNITFDFAAIEPSRPFLVRYQYILEGNDNVWRPITEKTTVSFGNISEGTYTFKLKAKSPDGIWSTPIEYTFKVLPPLYRSWWAYTLYSFMIFFLFYGIFRWRTHSLLRNKELLEQTIVDRTKELQKSSEELQKSTEELEATNKELEAFSYSVSHDLRAPLRAVIGYSKILEDNFGQKLDVDGRSTLNAILNNSKKMNQLIDDLLTFSKSGKAEMMTTEIDMSALVKSVIEEEMIGNANETDFTVNEILPVKGTQNLIKQVWINLISNAIKYSSHKAKPIIEIGSFIKNNNTVYFVKDNGAGFDMQYYDKLFGVFQRLHSEEEFEGTGIGLAIVQKIINRHNGKVWAESKLDEGSCFYFSLPIINS
jgi:ligand-binding sensor domain-containing protein/signal transduction histidine kinase